MSDRRDHSTPNRIFRIGLARAVGGAIIFALPMLMTMEMWELGASMDRFRLALLLVLGVPLLIGLSHYIGFEDTIDWLDDGVDAFVAYAVGFVASAAVLTVFGVVGPDLTASGAVGMIALQALVGAIGALLAQNQFGLPEDEERMEGRVRTYAAELFVMAAGALFLAFNVAPTEEMVLIAHQMTAWHTLGLVVLSLTLMHAFVYAVQFSGQEPYDPDGTSGWSLFVRYTVAGYAVCLAISLYVLWSFGRLDGLGFQPALMAAVVLSFPAAIGAAAARLIL